MTIGRVAGVTVRLDWSVLIIAGLLTWSLASDALPTWAGGYSTAAYWLVGAAAALLFLVSLLAHELAHSVVARRHGIPVHDITLWMLGGMSSLTSEPPDATTALRIAIVGPATSLAGALVFGAVALTATVIGASRLVVAALVWLAVINAVLALFNLIPAAPLDGGRVLAALLWRRHGDRRRAAASAAAAGRVFAYALVGIGVVEIALGDVVGGVWFGVLGWFVLTMARAEGAAASPRPESSGPCVADAMTAHPITVPATMPAEALFEDYALRHDGASFPVVGRDGAVVGLVTFARLAARGVGGHVVGDVMWPLTDVAPASDHERLSTVTARMRASASHCAFVFHDGRLVGLVTPNDVARARA